MPENDEERDSSQAFCHLYGTIRSLQKKHAGQCDRNIAALHRCKEEIEAMILSLFPSQTDDPNDLSLFIFDRDED